jgi:hypothetical protein
LPTSPQNQSATANTNYRVILQPRPIAGEPVQAFPPNVGIDVTTPGPVWNAGNAPSNPPASTNAAGSFDILFSPSGAVIGANTGTGVILLLVRNTQTSNSTDRFVGKPVLVTVQTRTGFIAQHPVAPGVDPYAFVRDGKSSGM